MKPSHLIVGVAAALFLVLVACSDSATDSATPFGCCALGSRPSVCTLMLGRAKRSADDNCIDGFDGVNPDPNAPGWTVVNDSDGCGRWTPPPNAPFIQCGAKGDAGRDASDAAVTDASDGG